MSGIDGRMALIIYFHAALVVYCFGTEWLVVGREVDGRKIFSCES